CAGFAQVSERLDMLTGKHFLCEASQPLLFVSPRLFGQFGIADREFAVRKCLWPVGVDESELRTEMPHHLLHIGHYCLARLRIVDGKQYPLEGQHDSNGS